MFDITLRPLKDSLFDPVCKTIPKSITPLQITALAAVAGLISSIAAASKQPSYALSFWLLNRILDCLDGAVARQRGLASDLGGFLDLLSDFVYYSAIPICCAWGLESGGAGSTEYVRRLWFSVALAELSFHINNFVLFFVGAVVEKRKAVAADAKESGKRVAEDAVRELTSVSMRPALVEGAESGAIFTVMLAAPRWTESLCWVLIIGVVIGIVQRVLWVTRAL